MTFSQLLGKSIDDLEKMSYEELHNYLEPYLKVTRPELAPKYEHNNFKARGNSFNNRKHKSEDEKLLQGKKQLIQQILANRGVKIRL